MTGSDEDVLECGAQYPMRLCADCDHQRYTHSKDGHCYVELDDELCGCPEWIDSGLPVILCEEYQGPNAFTDPVMEEDENGEPYIAIPPQPRHVHKGQLKDSNGKTLEVIRWENND